MNEKTVAAYTLGCKVNLCDTEEILARFVQAGYKTVDFASGADIYIINTCTVTAMSDKKSRQIIRRARAQNPKSIIAVCGCYSQAAPEEVIKIEGVDLVTGTGAREKIVGLVEDYQQISARRSRVSAASSAAEIPNGANPTADPVTPGNAPGAYGGVSEASGRFAARTRAFLKIQDGCDCWCSYCVIPIVRGPARSRACGETLAEAEALAGSGCKEIVLTGIHTASYGKDLNEKDAFITLIQRVHSIEGIARVRLSSLDPRVVTPEFVNGLRKLPKLCPHFHLSLQSGCGTTLARMNRRYTPEEYAGKAALLRQAFPGAALTTDVIVGFPGESEEDFLSCYEFVKAIHFAKVHVFPFSPKKGTAAEKFPNQVPRGQKTSRAEKLLALSRAMENEFIAKLCGETAEVLFEQHLGGGVYAGHTPSYIKVHADSRVDVTNKILPVKITAALDQRAHGDILRGEIT
ncbi:MAG: tRNA (N(6)-L-threonylcarbamoyladenosine(37)-C(2))-methylthiotransferase MtaB [Clostridiales bacterium]|jgi:threonylcarbamoyladenosine tRNA methylthiotransferase MtaB|nr:tRNA (N(6)-L-threonylcarbamoyladenosine(37)-C(2))-methylthiotransferase MtaB [Clostridiales bacterium]